MEPRLTLSLFYPTVSASQVLGSHICTTPSTRWTCAKKSAKKKSKYRGEVGGGSQGEAWEELGPRAQAKLTSDSVYALNYPWVTNTP